MELDGLAMCLAHSRPGNGGPNDITWKKLERLIHLCPSCQFKSVNKIPAIRQLRAALERQKERKPQFDRLYPPQEKLLDIKPETIYHFDELEQQAVLALCKYLCVSRGQYLHKILPLLLRYLATLHLAKWPPHYFKNLFLMKYQSSQNEQNSQSQIVQPKDNNNTTSPEQKQSQKHINDQSDIINGNNIEEEEEDETKDDVKINIRINNDDDHKLKANLSGIEEEPQKLDKARQSKHIEDDESQNKNDPNSTPTPATKPIPSLTADKSATNLSLGTSIGQDRARESDDEIKPEDQVNLHPFHVVLCYPCTKENESNYVNIYSRSLQRAERERKQRKSR